MKSAIIITCVAFLIANTSEASESIRDLPRYFNNPGLVFGSARDRRKDLSFMGKPFPRQYCRPERMCAYKPILTIDGGDRATGQTAARQGLSLWSAAADFLRSGSTKKLEQARTHLNVWIDADALSTVEGHMPLARHYLKRTLFPVITLYSMMREVLDIPKSERQKIEKWIYRGVKLMDQDNHDGNILSDGNNSRYSRDAVNMAWGIMVSDVASYQKGIQRFRTALEDLRSDGSLPLETDRGARAVSYQNLAISILIPIAEMAQIQGYDLYSERKNGNSIHEAIGFLIKAEKNETLIKAYTKEKQDKIRLGNHLHWTEIYLARFPNHINSKGLHDLRARYHFLTGRGNDFAGGNLSCLFAEPETNPVLTTRPPKKKIEKIRKISTVPRIKCPKWMK